MFFYMVEAQREDLEDDFVQNFHPVSFFVFSVHLHFLSIFTFHFIRVINSSSEAACYDCKTVFCESSRASSSPQKLKLLGAPVSIIVIDTHYCSCERRYFAESDQQAFVNLALRSDIHSAEQEH